MKITVGENDICNTCKYENPLICTMAGCQLTAKDCPAEYSDVFLDDTRNISDCRCYNAKAKKKQSVKEPIVIPDEILSAFQEFKKMRQKIKAPLTDIAVRRLLNRLNELAPNNYTLQNEMLLNSVDNCWKGVFLPNNSSSKDKLQSKPSYNMEEIKRRAMENTEI